MKNVKILLFIILFGGIIMLAVPVSAFKEIILDDRSVRFEDDFNSSKYMRIFTDFSSYRCLQECSIPVHIEYNDLLKESKSIITFTEAGIDSKGKTIGEDKIIKTKETLDKTIFYWNKTFLYKYFVPLEMEEIKVNWSFNLNDKFLFKLDPTIISGCTETATLIECTGSLTGNILNNSDSNRVIWIRDAKINASMGGSILNITSTGNINITNSNLTVFDGNTPPVVPPNDGNCDGDEGFPSNETRILITGTDLKIIDSYFNINANQGGKGQTGSNRFEVDNCGTVTGGTGGSGGNSRLSINVSHLIINRTSIDVLAGQGGEGGTGISLGACNAAADDDVDGGNGGSGGNATVIMDFSYIDLQDTIINIRSGKGGKGYDTGNDGNSAVGGDGGDSGFEEFILIGNFSSNINSFVNFSIPLGGGDSGEVGVCTACCLGGCSCDSGEKGQTNSVSYTWKGFGFEFTKGTNNTNIINLSSGQVVDTADNPTSGTRGKSDLYIEVNDSIKFGENYTIFTDLEKPNFHIFNFTGLNKIPRLQFLNTFVNGTINVYCQTPVLNHFITNIINAVLSVNYDNCAASVYNITSTSEFNQPIPFFQNNKTNATSIYPKNDNSLLLQIDIRDNSDIDSFRIAHNQTGGAGFENQSLITYFSTTETNVSYLFNLSINMTRGNVLGWQYWSNDSRDWINTSDIFTATVVNTPPLNLNVSLTPLPLGSADTVKGHFNFSDQADLDTEDETERYQRWYKNGAEILNARNNTILGTDNFTSGDNIIFSSRVNDGFDFSDWVNTSTANVDDTTKPVLNFNTLADLNFSIRCSDASSTLNKINYTLTKPDGTFEIKSSTSDFTIDTSVNDYIANITLSTPHTLLNGSYNITQVGCLDGNANYIENITTQNLNFSIAPIKIIAPSISDSSITTTETTNLIFVCQSDFKLKINKINFTINISDNSEIIRDNPTFFSFTQSDNINLTYEIFDTSETANVGDYNITQIGCRDTETNYIENITTIDLEFTVTSPSGNGNGGGGGGGGLQAITIINETILKGAVCNFNGICEGPLGEDFLNCGNEKSGLFDKGGDCGFEVGALTCADPEGQCILRFGFVIRAITIAMIFSVLIVVFLSPEDFEKFKRKARSITKNIGGK